MLLEKDTFEKFGYKPENLGESSNKTILLKCDYCGCVVESSPKRRKIANKITQTDCCNKKCKYIKMKENNLSKYGVENAFQRQSVKEQIKETVREKYGVDNWVQSEEFKNQAKETCLEKYGVENAMQNKEFKIKRKEYTQNKYGVDNVSRVKEFKEKRKKTCLLKFGDEFFMSSDIGRKRLNDGVMEKYGVENVFQLEEIKDKIKQTCLEKYGVEHHLQNKELALASAKKGVETKISNGQIKVYDNKTMSQWADEIGFSKSRFSVLVGELGFEKAVKMTPKISSLEQIMMNFLDLNNIKYVRCKKLDRYIPDFIIDDYKLVLECDGLYWHSEYQCKDRDYHFNKKETYNSSGYKSLFFREDEIFQHFNKVTSMILNKCNLSQSIYARKCNVSVIDVKDSKKFLNDNHLMNFGKGISYGLRYNNELVMILQIKRIGLNDFEISRLCPKNGVTVVGGFSKLLQYAEKNLDMNRLTTFIDRRYGDGAYLPKFGFTLSSCYPSFRWTDSKNTFHRMRFVNNSGYDKGMIKIWDCGQTKYIKNYGKK